jgi:uncharacterized protein (DUF2249 family)
VGTSNDHFYGQSQCRHGQSTSAAKGIDLSKFHNQNTADPEKIHAIVTRSLSPEYRHAIILNSFNLLHQGIDFTLTIVGDGTELATLKELTIKLNIERKVFSREEFQIRNYLNYYAPLIFTLVCQSLKEYQHRYLKRWPLIYPIVTNIAGNKSWITHRKTDN